MTSQLDASFLSLFPQCSFMGKIRSVVTVEGDVQGVGYRNFVRRIARKFKVAGYVKNLDDSDVEIVCEGKKFVVDSFIEAVQKCPRPISVESVNVHYSEATGEYDRFRIKTGRLAEELLEGFETGVSYLNLVRDDLKSEIRSGNESLAQEIRSGNESLKDEIRSGNKSLKAEIRSGNQTLTQEIQSVGEKVAGVGKNINALRQETRVNFTFLANRYGEISKMMVKIFEELKTERKQNREGMKKLVSAILNSRK